jgi:hypothetical protein
LAWQRFRRRASTAIAVNEAEAIPVGEALVELSLLGAELICELIAELICRVISFARRPN